MSAVLDPVAPDSAYQRPPLVTFHWPEFESAEEVSVMLRTAARADGLIVLQCDECPRGMRIDPARAIPNTVRHMDAVVLSRARSWARYWAGKAALIINPADLGGLLAEHFGEYPSTAIRRRGPIKEFL